MLLVRHADEASTPPPLCLAKRSSRSPATEEFESAFLQRRVKCQPDFPASWYAPDEVIGIPAPSVRAVVTRSTSGRGRWPTRAAPSA
jgi:hypothetical protein